MSWLFWTCTVLGGLGVTYFFLMMLAAVKTVRALPVLERLRPREPARWPALTVVVPACNEGPEIEAATRAKLDDGYPDLQVVLVDDRSTDDTGAIVDRLAAGDPRVTPLHIRQLPDGWLGKLHAMREGLAHARGEWVLLSDADVHFRPGTLRRAIAHCEENGLDHLAVFPTAWTSGVSIDACNAAFCRLIFVAGRLWGVPDPESRTSAGVGAFNLVRRAALDRTPGLEWLRLEVGDDMALGQMLKRSGARSAIANGRGLVGLRLYRTWREMARSVEKGTTAFKFSLARGLLACAILLLLELAPALALGLGGGPLPWALGAAGLALSLGAALTLNRFMGHATLPSVLAPLGAVAIILLCARGVVLGAVRGGVTWRGQLYPAKALLEGRRLEFP